MKIYCQETHRKGEDWVDLIVRKDSGDCQIIDHPSLDKDIEFTQVSDIVVALGATGIEISPFEAECLLNELHAYNLPLTAELTYSWCNAT